MANVNNNNAFSVRKAAAQPTGWAAVAAFAAGEALTKVTKAVAGDGYKTMACARYLDKRATGRVFGGFDLEAAFTAAEEVAAPTEKGHSDMVEWKKGKWVPSAKAQEVAKKAGYEQAFLPQMYKAANWISRVAKEGGDKVYSTAQGETHTYLGWTYKAVYGHAAFMEGKGVKNAKTAEKLAEYFEQACKHSKMAEDKLPTWEEVCAAVQAEQKLAKEEATVEAEVVVETAEVEEARDGRAPKTTPAASKVDVKSIVRSLGIVRLKEDNAWEVAEKAKAAFEAATLTEEEFYAVVDACQAKDASADPEEYMALLGEN